MQIAFVPADTLAHVQTERHRVTDWRNDKWQKTDKWQCTFKGSNGDHELELNRYLFKLCLILTINVNLYLEVSIKSLKSCVFKFNRTRAALETRKRHDIPNATNLWFINVPFRMWFDVYLASYVALMINGFIRLICKKHVTIILVFIR